VYKEWKKGRQGKEEHLRLRREFRDKYKKKEKRKRKRLEEDQKYHNRSAGMEICEFRQEESQHN